MCLFTSLGLFSCSSPATPVVVAPVNTSSQKILAEIIAGQLRARGIAANAGRTFDTTADAHQALIAHEADIAIEYSGAAWMTVLHHELPERRIAPLIRGRVRSEYAAQQLRWFDSLGFSDPFVLMMWQAQAAEVRTLSEAERHGPWTLATMAEFLTRADGFDALMQAYPRLRWKKPAETMAPDALYAALAEAQVAMISAHASDPRCSQPGVRVLADDEHLLAPEEASIVVRFDSLSAHPGMAAAVASVSGRISLEQMRAMDAEVESDHFSPAAVAADFTDHLRR